MNFFLFSKRLITHSKIHGAISIGKSYGQKALLTGSVVQSGGEITSMYQHIINDLKKSGFKPKNFLLLGVGGGTVVTIIRKAYPSILITGVDIDPVIITVAKEHFELGNYPDITIIIADAISWITNKNNKEKYDLVIVDLFIGATNPTATRTNLFLKNIKKKIAREGILLYNADYQENNRLKYEAFFAICKLHFRRIEEVFSYPLNRVLLLK